MESTTTGRASPSNPSTETSDASSGLTDASKIGIGLGVPFGVLVVSVIVGFLIICRRRHKKTSRLEHHGTLAAVGVHPAVGEEEKVGHASEIISAIQQPEHGLRPEMEGSGGVKGAHEVHGDAVPFYRRELPGSAGVKRWELLERRESV